MSPRQQAERRPQTRGDAESYDKARDYFSEGSAAAAGPRGHGALRALSLFLVPSFFLSLFVVLFVRVGLTHPGLSSSPQH